MSRLPLSRALVLAGLALGSIAGCKLSTEPLPDVTLCQHTNPENGGCARLRGVIIDSAGQPIELAQLVLRVDTARDKASYLSSVSTTSSDGQFGLELRRANPLTPTPTPDTITTHLVFGVPDPSSFTRLIIDSVDVLLHLQPPGSTAIIDTITVRPPKH